MYALQKVVERKLSFDGNDDLAVQDEALRFQTQRACYDLRKISLQILAALGSESDFSAVPRKDAAEAVPFWLVLPLRSHRDIVDGTRFMAAMAWVGFMPLFASGRETSISWIALRPWPIFSGRGFA